MTDRSLEGWYSDPYGLHEARWMSQGTPTALVRDGEVEGHDPAPDGPFRVEPEPIWDATNPVRDQEDLRREEAAEKEDYEQSKATRSAFDVFDQSDS